MATGTTLLEGWVNRLGAWIRWVFLAYLLLFSLVTGGMLSSACGVAGTGLAPLGEASQSRLIWGAIHSMTALVLIWFGGYALLKRVLAVCVGAMFCHGHRDRVPSCPDWPSVARGLIPSLPAGGAGWVIGLVGAIGGTMALISYGYWIREGGARARRDCASAGPICCCPTR